MDKQPLNEMANVRNPKLWPDPDTIKMKELYKYKSLDSVKISQTFRNVKSAVPYLCYLNGIIQVDLELPASLLRYMLRRMLISKYSAKTVISP